MTQNKINILLAEIFDTVVEIRRHIHADPELSGFEKSTSEYICSYLDKWDIPYKKIDGEYSIVADINSNCKDCIAIRADIDALPICETNEVEYKSHNEGVMHACGHDVHTASLLGTAYILSKLKSEIDGNIRLFFQSSEEVLPGGAKKMIDAGILSKKKPKCIIGQHVLPNLDCGKIGFRSGRYMASCDEIYLTVIGKGGHAATPELTVNPINIAAEIIVALQDIDKKYNTKHIPSILSFGRVVALGKTNVVPDKVSLEGTFRTLDENWRAEVKKNIADVCDSISRKYGGKSELNIVHGYPTLFNNEKLTSFFKGLCEELLGANNVVELPIRMTSDDFAYFSQEIPSLFYRFGTGRNTNVHSSNFDIDENSMKTNISVLSNIAIELLKK